ncbi:MAG TPA: AhpC/TSA family protein [Terriglobales bacterium]
MAEIAKKRVAIVAKGTQLAFVHLSTEELARKFFASYGLEDTERVSDQQRKLYKTFKLVRGGFPQFLGLKTLKRAFAAGIINGHGLGKLTGDAFQMPGVFLIHESRILRAFVHRTVADQPNYIELAN